MKLFKKGLILLAGIIAVVAMGGCSKKSDGSEAKAASNHATQDTRDAETPLNKMAPEIPKDEASDIIPTDIDETPQKIYGPPEMLNDLDSFDRSEEPKVGEPELKDTPDDNPDKTIKEYKQLPDDDFVALYGVRAMYGVQMK